MDTLRFFPPSSSIDGDCAVEDDDKDRGEKGFNGITRRITWKEIVTRIRGVVVRLGAASFPSFQERNNYGQFWMMCWNRIVCVRNTTGTMH